MSCSKYSLRNKTQVSNGTLDEPQIKKKQKKSSLTITTYASTESTTIDYFNDKLPNECIFKILTYLNEYDLIEISKVCKKLNNISNDCKLWRNLYIKLFGINFTIVKLRKEIVEQDLMQKEIHGNNKCCCYYTFYNENESTIDNKWKLSFLQFNETSCHVIQSNNEFKRIKKLNEKCGRLMQITNKIEQALEICKKDKNIKYIFIHKGNYKNENLIIDFNINIICLSPNNDDVIISSNKHTCIKFTSANVTNAYLGYCSINVSI